MMQIALLRNLFRNLGDEAMLACELAAIRARLPSSSIVLLVDEPTEAASSFAASTAHSDIVLMRPHSGAGVPSALKKSASGLPVAAWRTLMIGAFEQRMLPRALVPRSIAELRNQLAAADVVIAGGSLLPSQRALYETREAVFRTLARLGKPLVLSGQSLYPFAGRAAPYRLATRIVLRDDCFSRAHGIAAGLRDQQLVDGVDPAFALPPAEAAAVESELAALGIAGGERYIAVSLRSGSLPFQNIAQALRSAVSQKLADSVLLFGMQRYWRDHDGEVLRPFEQQLTGLCVRSAPAWPAPVLKGVLSRARAVVACRYHAAVFSLTSGTPSVSVAASPEYEWKLRGIYHQFDHPGWLTGPDQFEATLLDLLRHRELLAPGLHEKERQLRPRVSRLVETVEDVLERRRYARSC